MGMLNLYQFAIVTVKGQTHRLGNLNVPVPMVDLGECDDGTIELDPESTAVLFDVASNRLDSFDFLWVQSDFDVMLEFITDDENDIGQEEATFELKGTGTGNIFGPALVLGSDVSYANYTTLFAAGTLDKIEKIIARNLSEADVASIRIFVGKASA